MRVFRIIGSFLAAAVLLSSLGQTSASAAPSVTPLLTLSLFNQPSTTVPIGSELYVNAKCSNCGNGNMALTGSLTLSVNGTDVQSYPSAATGVSFGYTPLTVGTYVLQAHLTGDSYFTDTTTSTLTLTATKAFGTPVLEINGIVTRDDFNKTVSTAPDLAMQFNYRAAGLSTLPAATGTLIVAIDGTTIQTATLPLSTPENEVDVPSGLPVGTHTATVSYTGDSTYAPGVEIQTIKVAKLDTPYLTDLYSCMYNCSPYQATVNQSFAIDVIPGSPYTLLGPTPSGTVTASLNGVPVSTVALSNGGARFVLQQSIPGLYSYKYSYSGDAHYLPSRTDGNIAVSVVDPTLPIPSTQTPAIKSYNVISSSGSVYSSMSSRTPGTSAPLQLNKPIVGGASLPTRLGFWQVASDGGIFAFGNAKFFGSTGSIKLNQPIVGMASTPTGYGYWLVASDGGIFAYGDAKFFGSTGSIKLNKPIVGMTATPSGNGYWLVASDGGIFAYGDATFYGSTGAIRLNQPIVGMASTPSGNGYWLVASDGGIFAYGDARFFGSTGSIKLNQPIVGMMATPLNAGYSMVAADGGIFNFGDAQFDGSNVHNGTVVAVVH